MHLTTHSAIHFYIGTLKPKIYGIKWNISKRLIVQFDLLFAYSSIRLSIRLCVYIHLCIFVCACLWACVFVDVCVCRHACKRTHPYMRICVHADIRALCQHCFAVFQSQICLYDFFLYFLAQEHQLKYFTLYTILATRPSFSRVQK